MTFPFRPELIDELSQRLPVFLDNRRPSVQEKRDTIFLFQAQLKLHSSQGF
ncbi:MAG: hypothetical protein VKL00_04365 [Synechococcales bacterium]|nr:hypothetical protein [Cyanobacteria bacterium REEB444]MEB3124862.1 hypothetical protein [Synechococcales bacterium]